MEEHLIDVIIFVVFVVLALLRLLKSGLDRLSNAEKPSAPAGEPKRDATTTAGGGAYGQPPNNWQYNRPAKPPTPSPKPRPVTETPDYHTAFANLSKSTGKTVAKSRQPPPPPSSPQTQFGSGGGEVQRGIRGQPRTGRAFSGEVPRFTEATGRKRRPEILVDLKNKRKLRLAMITREVIDRPRAFDM